MSEQVDEENQAKMEEYDMCQAIRELIEDGRQEGISEGRLEGRLDTLTELVKEGLLKIEEAAKRMNLTVEEFSQRMRQ